MEGSVETNQEALSADTVFRFSWVAYLRPLIVLALAWAGAGIIYQFYAPAAYIIAPVGLALAVYDVWWFRTAYLFLNGEGVWFFSGVFPWHKGVRGIRWRDIEDARYFTGFFPWLFRTYTIRVQERFTDSTELHVPWIWRGNLFAQIVNRRHGDHLRANGDH
ncbi:hypothetical protein P8631_11485 (plasmid) [Guyparkeria sp. 1SP6A2]|nr:hypothetical protein [Guyparkeria sp. 1SP6A2]